MAEPTDHNRIIAAAGQRILAPLGCQRKGKSRLWFDDHGWWVTVVEFQPSSWSKGSYLNVGAMWLWNAKPHWSFDDGYRVEAFKQFKSPGQFSDVADQIAHAAAERVLAYREKFTSLPAVAQYLQGKKRESLWDYYHAAVALELSGESERAAQEFSAVMRSAADAPWVEELQKKARTLFAQNSSRLSFCTAVRDEVAKARALLKLSPLPQGAAPWP